MRFKGALGSYDNAVFWDMHMNICVSMRLCVCIDSREFSLDASGPAIAMHA